MIKFIGEFSELEKLGFIKNKYGDYYFLPTHGNSNPVNINIKTRVVEYADDSDLKLIEKFVKEIV